MSELVALAPTNTPPKVAMQTSVRTIGGGWGWLPVLSVISALGLVIVAIGFTASRAELVWAQAIFWLGYVILLVPPVIRIAIGTVSRAEALGVLLIFGVGMYLVKLLYSPLWFTMGDETQHWRTTYDIIQTGHLFTRNPILHVSPFYPGLENPTTAVISLTGLSIFHAGTLVAGVARALLVMGFYHLFELATRSRRVASIGTLVYMLGPQFVMFDAQFAYGSLALGLTTVVLFCLLEHTSTPRVQPTHLIATLGVACFGILAITVTHHISSYALAGFVGLWTAVTYVRRDWSQQRAALGWCATIGIIAGLGWLALVATITIPYLGQPIVGSIEKTVSLLSGTRPPRQMFAPVAGKAIPLWIRLSGFASGGFVLAALPWGWWQTIRKYNRNSIAMALLVFSLAHPAIQVIRLTPDGLATGGRALSYVFWAVGFVVAVGFTHLFEHSRWAKLWKAVFTAWTTTIVVGSMAALLSVWRLPGGYDPNSYTRFIQAGGISAAEWARLNLGSGNTIGGSEPVGILMGAYGVQNAVGPQDDIYLPEVIFTAPEIGADQLQYLRNSRLDYLQIYYVQGQSSDVLESLEISGQARKKMDALPQVDRIFDSSDVTIYDVRRLKDLPNAP